MRIINILLLVLIAMMMPNIMFAQENISTLTVNDGTTLTDCVPLWGPENNPDIFVQECEYIIPAESLEAMKYHKLSGITYYLDMSTYSFDYSGNEFLEVYLMTVDQTVFDNELIPVGDDKQVYYGNIIVNGQEMQIDFYDKPFTYTGGNLLVYTRVQTDYYIPTGLSFYGERSDNSAICNYTYYDTSTEMFIKNFLPQVTFFYDNEVVGMPVPFDLAVSDVTSKSATLCWDCNSGIDKWDLAYRNNINLNEYPFDNDEEGWSIIDKDGNGNCWVWNNHYMRSAFTSNDKKSGEDYLVSPVVTLGGNLIFKARGGQSGCQDFFEVYVTTNDNLNVSEYTKIYKSPSITSNADWLPFEVDLSSYQGQTGRVAIRHLNGSDASFLDVDNISITDPWTIVSNVSTKTYTLNNLEQDTPYIVKTRSVHGNSTGKWSDSVGFNTKTAINISSAGWATFCWDRPLDFSDNADLKVYYISDLGKDDNQNVNKVQLTQITNVPENTGILIKGDAGQYEIPETDTSTGVIGESDDFAFVGVNESTEIGPTVGDFTNFILAMNNDKVGFYKVGSTGFLAAHKAYLKVNLGNSSQVDVISFVVDDEDGISDVIQSRSNEDIWFTIGGVRVHEPKLGLYIRNGEKVVVK